MEGTGEVRQDRTGRSSLEEPLQKWRLAGKDRGTLAKVSGTPSTCPSVGDTLAEMAMHTGRCTGMEGAEPQPPGTWFAC